MTEGNLPLVRFTVDTHLFRELGELLVGRESTALIELVKNSYDPDATEVTVFGAHLGDPIRGIIQITDNGVGMDPETFQRGFLRVASRIKNAGDRKSFRWKRRFTGAKGVGRLAAHKLACKIEVHSTPWTSEARPVVGVNGLIDWDKVEQAETLDEIPADAVKATPRPVSQGDAHGTTLTLTRLRRKWTSAQRTRFLLEVEALQAPTILTTALPTRVVPAGSLFECPLAVDSRSEEPGFKLLLQGDFEVGDNYWPAVIDAANWLLEIRAAPDLVRYAVAPTKRTLTEFPHARPITFSETHPAPEQGPFFDARILIREGQAPGKKAERTWASRFGGVRVYMEGFRVLPYGEESDDWLALGRDTNDRTRKLRFLNNSTAPGSFAEVDDEGLLLLPNKHYFGGVFLTADRAGTLQMLVNREGFVPDASFELLVTIVRRGIDLSTRVRAAAKASGGNPTLALSGEHGDPSRSPRSLKGTAEGALRRLAAQANELKELAAKAPVDLKERLIQVAEEVGHATAISREVLPANSMVLVLASVGTQLAAFTHEVNRLLGLALDLETTLVRSGTESSQSSSKHQIQKAAMAAADLRRAIERQAAYLVDIVTPDARRRRSRQKIGEALNSTWKLVATAAEQRGISFENEVDTDLRTPPLFRSELMAVLSNLLTNAVKAAGPGGKIRAKAQTSVDGALSVCLENTGVAVDPHEGEFWFRPFESTTIEVDPVLGQGMGLGLGITRDLLAEVGATIQFVHPQSGYATAIEITFPGVA